MAGRQPAEFISRKDSLHLAAHRFVEAVALLAQGVVDEQKTAVGKKTPKRFYFLRAKGLEFISPGQIEKGIIEQVIVSQRDFVADRRGFDTGARHELLHERRYRQRMGIPITATIFDLGENELQLAFLFRMICPGQVWAKTCCQQAGKKCAKEFATIHKLQLRQIKKSKIERQSFNFSLSIVFQKRCASQPSNSKVTMRNPSKGRARSVRVPPSLRASTGMTSARIGLSLACSSPAPISSRRDSNKGALTA